MTPQHQTVFGDGKGNCFATCIACILDLPVERVPNFCGDHPESDGEWLRAANRWLAQFGLRYIEFTFGDWVTDSHGLPGCHVVVSGPGPRGCDHATVWLDGKLAHDPHPSGAGLIEPKFVGCFVAINPNQVALSMGGAA